MTAQEITLIIDTIHEGVEKSKCGKIISPDKDPNGNSIFNSLPLQTYLKIIEHTFKEVK